MHLALTTLSLVTCCLLAACGGPIATDEPRLGTARQALADADCVSWGVSYLGAPDAWAMGARGDGVVVAVIDTGVDARHPDLRGRVLPGRSFVDGEPDATVDTHGHGTHCAGTIAGSTHGVAPGATILPVKVLSSRGSGTWESVAYGVEYAVEQGASVLDLSLPSQCGAEAAARIGESIRRAITAGVSVVIPAGNCVEAAGELGTPGDVAEAITVAPVDDEGRLPYFSSRGPTFAGTRKPDISAPGVSICSAWRAGGTKTISGTSMATPHVAGLLALMLQRHRGQSTPALKDVLLRSTGNTTWSPGTGYGVPDAGRAVELLRRRVD